jgi:hypothetical protein
MRLYPPHMRKRCFPDTFQDPHKRVSAKVVGKCIVRRSKSDIVSYRLEVAGCNQPDGFPYPMTCSIKFFTFKLSDAEKQLPTVLMDEEDAVVVDQIGGVPVPGIMQPDQHVAGEEAAERYGGNSSEPDEGDERASIQETTVLLEERHFSNDNEPAPENIPSTLPLNPNDGPAWSEGYSHPGVCPREISRSMLHTRLMTGEINNYQADGMSRGSIFLHFCPLKYWDDVIVSATNETDPGLHLTLRELVLWVALRLLMATQKVSDVRAWFQTSRRPCMNTGVPVHLNKLMSGKRFFRILHALTFQLAADFAANRNPDRFREQRPLQTAWNDNMEFAYTPGELLVLDESVMRWLTQRTCPGWMFLPRKPWPFGGESHTIADKANNVIFRLGYSEGRDRPTGTRKEFEGEYGQGVISMLLRLCKTVFGSGRTVYLDSGFCVLQGIVALGLKGLFACAQIKSRRCVCLVQEFLYFIACFLDWLFFVSTRRPLRPPPFHPPGTGLSGVSATTTLGT